MLLVELVQKRAKLVDFQFPSWEPSPLVVPVIIQVRLDLEVFGLRDVQELLAQRVMVRPRSPSEVFVRHEIQGLKRHGTIALQALDEIVEFRHFHST